MRFRTSWFNRDLCGHLVRRFWPGMAAMLILCVGCLCLPYYSTLKSMDPSLYGSMGDYAFSQALQYSELLLAISLPAACAAALLLFRHLHSMKESAFYLSLPMKRRAVFLSCALAGYGMLAIPLALAGGLMALISLSFGGGAAGPMILMGAGLGSLLLFWAMAVLSAILAGNALGALLIYAGANCFAAAILTCAGEIAAFFVPGMSYETLLPGLAQWLSPAWKLMEAGLPVYTGPNFTATGLACPAAYPVYALGGILLLALSCFLYGIRPAERAGETVAFRPVGHISRICGALLVSGAGTLILVNLLYLREDLGFGALTLIVLAFLIAGFLAAEMIISRSFRVFHRGRMLELILTAAAVLLLMLGAKADPIGYVTRLPAADEIESVSLSYGGNGIEITAEDALSFHETILSNLDCLSNGTSEYGGTAISLSYQLKKGKELNRTYIQFYDADRMDETPITDALEALLKDPDYVYGSWFSGWTRAPEEDCFIYCDVGAFDEYDEEGNVLPRESTIPDYLDLTAAEAMTLYEAVCLDIQSGNVPAAGSRAEMEGESLGYIDFEFALEPYDPGAWGSRSAYEGGVMENFSCVSIFPTMTNTLSALEEISGKISE